MLNVGIIGNTKVLEPHVKHLQKNKIINVIGKASVGTSAELNGFHFSIPEFNKVELIERADILLIDNSSPLPFEMLSNIIKKSKHIFITEYLDIAIEECAELIKLAAESGSVVQVINPFYYTPAIQWLNKNITLPLFLDISKYTTGDTFKKNLFPLLLMLTDITGISTKKVSATHFELAQNETNFTNIRLKFSDASVVNINLQTQQLVDKFDIEVFSRNQFISLNFNEEVFLINSSPIKLSDDLTISEYDQFVESIQNQTQKSNNLAECFSALQLVEIIEKKITQFIV
jgi:MinD-like ATPase involved in chromosome partitioning or flagellar assembly